MNSEIITFKKEYPVSRRFLWRALTDNELMKQWYFDLPGFRPEIGYKFTFIGGPSPERQYVHVCEVTQVVPLEKIAYSWQYQGFEGNSLVSFDLEQKESSTLLTLTHDGIKSFPAANPDFDITNFREGWEYFIHIGLKDFIEANS